MGAYVHARHAGVLVERLEGVDGIGQPQLLPHALLPSVSIEDELFVVTTTFQGRAASMPELRDQLADEVEHRQALLSAREREIIENHLIGDVAAHLHGFLRGGEEWVTKVNAELDRMPTSTGMRLRFVWAPLTDGPAGLKEARRRLLAHHAGWSPQQREEVGGRHGVNFTRRPRQDFSLPPRSGSL